MTRPYLLLALLSSAISLVPRPVHAQAADPNTPPAPAARPSATAPQSSHSFDASDTRILSDPLYLPMKGQLFGMTSYTLDTPRGDNFKGGTNTGSFKASDSLFDETLAYGLTNDLTIRMSLGYGVNSRDSTAAATGDVTTGNSRGFNDPTFSATVRVLDESASPLVLDLTGSYSPNVFASIASGGVGEGSLGRGGQTSGLSLGLGHEAKSFTVAATAGVSYVGQQITQLLSNSTSTESDAHWSYSAGLTTQTRFTDRVSLNAGVTFSMAGNYGVSNLDQGNARTFSPASTRSLNLALNYHFSPNRLVGAFTYTYNNDSESTNTFTKASSDTAVENRMGNVVGFRLIYAFR